MATSVLDIWNLALARLGHKMVSDENEDTAEGRLLRTLYPNARDRMLTMVDWEFARGSVALEALDDAEAEGFWMFAYKYPTTNVLKFRRVLPVVDDGEEVPFEIALRKTGADLTLKKILCDAAAPTARYTRAITEVHRFDPLFVNSLAWELQAELVLSLSKNARGFAMSKQFSAEARGIAQASSANESAPRPRTARSTRARA